MNGKFKHYRLNYQITSPQLRLLSEDGKQIGIVSKLEALQKAKELNVDVVEIAQHAVPPVAKLIDFKKYKYQEAKKDRDSKKTQKNVTLKEVRLRPFIGQHDFDTRVKQAQDFVDDGNQVKVTIVYRGREITKKEFGFKVLDRFKSQITGAKLVREPRLEGKTLVAAFAPDKSLATKE